MVEHQIKLSPTLKLVEYIYKKKNYLKILNRTIGIFNITSSLFAGLIAAFSWRFFVQRKKEKVYFFFFSFY